jgi:hypothetical protein
MDWIELWFGFSPDNGDGSVELLVSLGVVVGLAVSLIAILRRRLHSAPRRAASTCHGAAAIERSPPVS